MTFEKNQAPIPDAVDINIGVLGMGGGLGEERLYTVHERVC